MHSPCPGAMPKRVQNPEMITMLKDRVRDSPISKNAFIYKSKPVCACVALGLLQWHAGWAQLPGKPLARSGEKQGVPESKVKSYMRKSKAGLQDLADLKTCSLLVLFGRFLQWPFRLSTWMVQCHRSRHHFLRIQDETNSGGDSDHSSQYFF